MINGNESLEPIEDKKIYLLAELTVLPGFLEEVKAILRRLLPRHSKSQAAKPYTRPDERMIHTSWCSLRSSPLRQHMSSTSNRTIQSECSHHWTARCPECQR